MTLIGPSLSDTVVRVLESGRVADWNGLCARYDHSLLHDVIVDAPLAEPVRALAQRLLDTAE